MGLIEWMLDRDVGTRCKIDDVLLHSWTNIYIDLDDYKWEDVIPSSSNGKCYPSIRSFLGSGVSKLVCTRYFSMFPELFSIKYETIYLYPQHHS